MTHLSDESENVNLLRLSNSVSTIHSLKIGLRVPTRRRTSARSPRRKKSDDEPVGIVENDDIGGSEINSESSGSSGEEEHKLLRVRFVVRIDRFHSFFVSGSSVESTVFCERDESARALSM